MSELEPLPTCTATVAEADPAQPPTSSAKPAQNRHQRRASLLLLVVSAALLLIVAVINAVLWLPLSDTNGLHQLYAVQAQVEAAQKHQQDLELRNAALRADIISLQNGLDGVEERARYDLGMIGRGETLYRILPPDAQYLLLDP